MNTHLFSNRAKINLGDIRLFGIQNEKWGLYQI